MALTKQLPYWFVVLLSLPSFPGRLWRMYKHDRKERAEQALLTDAHVSLVLMNSNPDLSYAAQLATDPTLTDIVERARTGSIVAVLIGKEVPRYVFISVNAAFMKLSRQYQHSLVTDGLAGLKILEEVLYVNTEPQEVVLAIQRYHQAIHLLHTVHGEKS